MRRKSPSCVRTRATSASAFFTPSALRWSMAATLTPASKDPKAKAFLRGYGFLSSILPYTNASWETLSIFLNFLASKLRAP